MDGITIEEYKKIAYKIINGLIKQNNTLKNLYKNQDLLNEIIHAIMMADWKFNGNGNKFGYRKQCVIWAIGSYFKSQKSFNNKMYHLSQCKGKIAVPDDRLYPNQNHNEDFNEILQKSGLSKIQKEYMYLRYYHDWTYQKIGDKFGVSKQEIQQSIQRAIDKLRSHKYSSV